MQTLKQFDYIIVGQGICGTFLSWYLEKAGKKFLVIDNNDPNAASRLAAGIINPVTGRRHVTVWKADEILPFAWHAYKELGQQLDITAITQTNLIDFFPNVQMLQSFLERIEERTSFLHSYPEQNHFNHLFNYDFGCGETRPVYAAHTEIILPAWRSYLEKNELILHEEFEQNFLFETSDGITYKNWSASKIIFCDGCSSVKNPFFEILPFAPNKGEALILEIEGIPGHTIFKRGMMLVPLAIPGRYWLGSDYQWEFEDDKPSASFLSGAEAILKTWLKIPFHILDHVAGVRPATLERRPFVGMHPFHPNIGILNGMGSKGCSLAPYFAYQLVQHLTEGTAILPEAGLDRFANLLKRSA